VTDNDSKRLDTIVEKLDEIIKQMKNQNWSVSIPNPIPIVKQEIEKVTQRQDALSAELRALREDLGAREQKKK
jgi:septation ring formation regulator EzrA